MIAPVLSLVSFAVVAAAHSNHAQKPFSGPHRDLWYNTIPGDGGTQVKMRYTWNGHIQQADCNVG
jgi:guanidinobutyrase / D-arginase